MKPRKHTLAAVFAAAAAAVFFASSTAQADTGVFRTLDRQPRGGAASFVSYGDRFNICDTQADGKYVTGYVRDGNDFNRVIYSLTDKRGNGKCVHADAPMGGKYNLVEGRHYWFMVCIGTNEYCNFVDDRA